MSAPEELWLSQIRAVGLIDPLREYQGIEGRKFRFDFAWPMLKVAAECEGGTFIRGRHSRPLGMAKDIEKYNLAALQGWLVIRATPQQIKSGEAIHWLEQALLPKK